MPFCDFIQNVSQAPSMCIFRWIKVLFPFPPIENDRKWLYQLVAIKYELKLPSEATPTSFAIQNQIEAVWGGNYMRKYGTLFALHSAHNSQQPYDEMHQGH